MSKQSDTGISIAKFKRLKQEAKKLKKELGLKHNEALERIAQKYKFGNWKAVIDACKINMPQSEIIFDCSDTKKPTKTSEDLVHKNKKTFTQMGIEFSVFVPTLTGLRKSILDATYPVRTHFEITNFHFYSSQQQGAREYKIIKKAFFLTSTEIIETQVSLYRPETKKGDPRMWFSALGKVAQAGSMVAIIIRDDCAYLINISHIDIEQCIRAGINPIQNFFQSYIKFKNAIVNELLAKLIELAKSPIKATHKGDTAIGMSIENALGIVANSSKKPDYKGIELKSTRSQKNRSTLFAQVADWTVSPLKSSANILDKFGYYRDDAFKLYCTIKTTVLNSQGLIFKYDKELGELQEWYAEKDITKIKFIDHIASWPESLLRKRLKEKHSETFWIEAESEMIGGIEYFHLKSIIHTQTPLLSQLMPLIDEGKITMDHLIKRDGGTKRVSEKGPLFKISPKHLDQLFPEPKRYELRK